ncbi:MAG: D-hexose-6-phosphate mutarotase [Rhodocyclaceae bacterium]|nr:MAG: D-hexose-6-phosphate mutarotase [Rhodocyclaceae bacterium]
MNTPPDWIDFNGLPAVRVAAPDGAKAIVTAHGAQLVSWVPARGRERLYLSERSAFSPGKAIRGGVPVIFPQFAERGSGPRHGFARTTDWQLDEPRGGADFACVTFFLEDAAATRAHWPHAFRAELTVAVSGTRLDIELEVENRGEAPFDFTAALHTYLRVAEVETASVEGLQGHGYEDNAAGGETRIDRAETLVVAGEVDRLYADAPATLLLREPGRSLAVQSEGFRDAVIWNPWEDKCAALADMPRDGFRRMLCIEAANAARPVCLEPGAIWFGRQTLVEV